MVFCDGRRAMGSNILGCNSFENSMLPKGMCGRIFDPDNMKICKAAPYGIEEITGLDRFESCIAGPSTFLDVDDYCEAPKDTGSRDDWYVEGLDCDQRKPIPSCSGLSIYKDVLNLQSDTYSHFPIGTKRHEWYEWDGIHNNFDPISQYDLNDTLSPQYANRLAELKRLCNKSYSRGMDSDDIDFNLRNTTGETPFEYCEWSDTFNSCSTSSDSCTYYRP